MNETDLIKTEIRKYQELLRKILQDEEAIRAEYWEAVESRDERRVQNALRAEAAMYQAAGSAKWYFFDAIKELKPPK